MKKDLISVIVPVYNVEKYLDECIESIVNQTYSNLEILLIDDGSKDNSGKICDEWAKRDSRIKSLHVKNGGLSSARNLGLENATGEWVSFIDSDDYIDLRMYEKLIGKSSGVEIVCCSLYTVTDGTLSKVNYKYANTETKLNMMRKTFEYHDWMVTDKIFKRKYIGDLKFNENVKIAEDMLFFYQYLDKVEYSASVYENLYYYRQVNSSLIHVMNPKKMITTIEVKDKVYDIFSKYKITERFQMQVDNICNYYIYKNMIGKDFNYNNYKDIIKKEIDNGIFRQKIGLANRLKLILAIYFTPIYICINKKCN